MYIINLLLFYVFFFFLSDLIIFKTKLLHVNINNNVILLCYI